MTPLVEIAEAVDQAAQARLATASGLVRRLQDEIAALQAGRLAVSGHSLDPGMLRALARHEVWIDGQRRKVLLRLAEARAEQESARLAASQSFGRLTALREIAEEEAHQHQRDRLRRSLAAAPTPGSAVRTGWPDRGT